jgi:hypothetical protein
MPWKRCGGENHHETVPRVRDILRDSIDHRVGSPHEWFSRQANPRVVEHPHVEVTIWRNDVDGVHDLSPKMFENSGFAAAIYP